MREIDNIVDFDNIYTRFVIVEKCIGDKYHTPDFDRFGQVYNIFSSFIGGNRIFINPGIYTREIDISIPKIELISYDLVESSTFSFRIEPEKTLSLPNGYEQYIDTS